MTTTSNGVLHAPEPMGTKATEPDPRAGWAAQKARVGGYSPPVRFTEQQRAVIDTAADLIIPPGRGFPAPSEVEIVEFVARYVTPASHEVKYYPLAAEHPFKDQLNRLGPAFLDAVPSQQIAALTALEKGAEDDATFFEQLRSLVYYGYYARAEVTAAIRKNLPAGRDYHGPPLPYGYDVEPWPDKEFPKRGTFIATEDVRFVSMPTDIADEYGVQS
ncbi:MULTISPECIES: gluconate 2-dehydrogenase subunit 3 family protein [unclassified Pseudonocardia]|jgi:hypothetical protein|uniref:gluconate 2-dehydrogenase subunit 3 family protein n=1 Tax=unclassified Pseudonocardia TaxID=2619320 RepID=UPI0009652265|nr:MULTISPECIES: gluconate 2-dehydrogenase subunit 3 family protein [unclassified Pseudonocardia]MBN9099965.1 gluconate 2-dehydrogenase subunit 3 family protein [Pseudonocardia sp.]OJY48149.1 MAG: hypothetical protein BGP03_10870 [Pseudonocardia sp. 73-21]